MFSFLRLILIELNLISPSLNRFIPVIQQLPWWFGLYTNSTKNNINIELDKARAVEKQINLNLTVSYPRWRALPVTKQSTKPTEPPTE